MTREQTPDIVVIGHIAQDLQADGTLRLGGTVTYAAMLAARHDLRVGVVTSGTPREMAALTALVPAAMVRCVASTTPTIFENRYQDGHREQFLRARATLLTAEAVPLEWRNAPITLLGPIADEIAPDIAACLSGQIRVASPQGWLRGWDATGRVYPLPWHDAEALLPYLTVLVLSVEDVATAAGDASGAAMIATWVRQVPCVIITDGPRDAAIWLDGQGPQPSAAFPVVEVDPTGAGDTFTTAFAIALWRTGDVIYATSYAHAAASFVVQAPGSDGMPTPAAIIARLGG